MPIEASGILVFSALRQRRRRRGVIEILVSVLFLALLLPNFVSSGLLGDLATGFAAALPPQTASCSTPSNPN